MYRFATRRVEFTLLVPVLLLVPLGVAVTNIAQTGVAEIGPMAVAIAFVVLIALAHLALAWSGHRGDELLLPAAAAMGAIGVVMLNRLPQDLAGNAALNLGMVGTQLAWFGVGLAAMLVVAIGLRDDGFLRHYKYSWGLFAALLLVVTFLFGTEVNDARLWIVIGPFGFQPSEAIKVMLVIFLAGYLAENRAVLAGASLRLGPLTLPPLPYLAPMLIVFAAVMLVVVVSRDLGTALLFFGVFLTMLFVATGRRAYVVFGMVLFVAGSAVAYLLFPHVAERINTWIDPWADPSGSGYQAIQALYAFARGGLLGEGLGQGLPMIEGRLPVPAVHTDMIFAAIGEELGLLGGVALLGMVAMLMARGLRIAVLARDDFSTMLAAGLTAGLVLQSLIIIGGNLKVVPLTGITLPFVSYGGSSLLASFVVVGILLSISHRSTPPTAAPGPESGP
ncbi:MAG TPA: FtsW/RodA/SpoVE family cell cycle protein [Candidatus Limnocylindria bacterium]|nr:FtsW/RodA/SpoVE family cell cycle protein [Candidatus Limnocylindria bacterium]